MIIWISSDPNDIWSDLDVENAGLGGAAAGVGLESDAGPKQESEKRNCRKTT